MKVTFEVPDEVGNEFQSAVPAKKRSKLVADFMAEQIRARHERDMEAWRVAEEIDKKDPSLREWEKF
jgi:hypothetical protein